jgi:chromosome segregation ATPase
MASTSEVGHAKNVANFQDLIAFVNGYGATYNPSKNSLKLPQLEALYTQASASLDGVVNKNTEYNNVVNERIEAFSDLRPLSTRLVNALDTTNASDEKVEDAKGFNRKIQGKRASKIETPVDPNQPAPKTISSSQQSYDQLIQHFEGMISVLASEPSYTPNETELQIATLQTKLQALKNSNAEVSKAYAEVSNSRLERNKILYSVDNGLVDTAGEVKQYVKSVYGASSPEFGQIKGIKFKTVKA